jgi:hypothetical protein
LQSQERFTVEVIEEGNGACKVSNCLKRQVQGKDALLVTLDRKESINPLWQGKSVVRRALPGRTVEALLRSARFIDSI